jgi:hypothetical protein
MTGRELVSQIDSAIERRHLLKHRFYHKWQAGTLSRSKLQLYAAQCYWHVEAFPVHLKDLSGRTTGRLHDVVLENLAEEEDPAAPHAKLWRDFAASVGLNEESLWFSAPLPGLENIGTDLSEDLPGASRCRSRRRAVRLRSASTGNCCEQDRGTAASLRRDQQERSSLFCSPRRSRPAASCGSAGIG